MAEEEIALVCMPLSTTEHVLPGSLIKRCSMCDQEIYVTKSGLITAGARAQLICLPCARKIHKPGDSIHELTEVQKNELRKAGVPEAEIQRLSGPEGVERLRKDLKQ
jgi:hypothetical protein